MNNGPKATLQSSHVGPVLTNSQLLMLCPAEHMDLFSSTQVKESIPVIFSNAVNHSLLRMR